MQRMRQQLLRIWFDLSLMSKGMIVISIPLVCILFSVIALVVFQGQRVELSQLITRAFQAGTRIGSVNSLLVMGHAQYYNLLNKCNKFKNRFT